MTGGEIISLADHPTRALVRDLLARADEAWTRRTSPAAVLQSIHARLDPADTGAIRHALHLSLTDETAGPEARAIVSGGIRVRGEAVIAQDATLLAALAAAYEDWPLTARILHLIRLLRAPPGSGEMPEDMRAAVGMLIRACADTTHADQAPLEMRQGFLLAAAGSDRLDGATRGTALAAGDGLVVRTQMQVPPAILLRILARSAAATRKASATAWAKACIAEAEIAGRLSDPALVHLAALAMFRETGIGLGGALALLKDAAAASLGWQPGGELERAFAAAPRAQEAGMVCRNLLVKPGPARSRNRTRAAREDTGPPDAGTSPRATRARTGARARAADVPGIDSGTTEQIGRMRHKPTKPSLAERQGTSATDDDAGLRAATRRAAARLLTQLRLKNAAKDKPLK